jgi:hypothetical protein
MNHSIRMLFLIVGRLFVTSSTSQGQAPGLPKIEITKISVGSMKGLVLVEGPWMTDAGTHKST